MRHPGVAVTFLLAFVLFQGLTWFVAEGSGASTATIPSVALGASLAGVLVLLWNYWQPGTQSPASTRPRLGTVAQQTVATTLWVTGPTFAYTVFDYRPGASASMLSMALVPVTASFLSHLREQDPEVDLLVRLWPGLAGLSGLLFLLAEPEPGSWHGWAALLSAPLLLSVAAVFTQEPASSGGTSLPLHCTRADRKALGLGLFIGGVILLMCRTSALSAGEVHPGAVLLQGIEVSASLWFLTRLGAVRWSAIYLLSPLLALVASLMLLRPKLDLRSVVGLVLLAVGGFYTLFRAGMPDDEEALSLLNRTS